MIRFESVSKEYADGTVAVDRLDLVAPSGAITVLVGPSGCGKTTSLRMINRMIQPTSGRIWLDDRDTATVPTHELRRGIGYVIQHAGLFPHRTVLDNITTVPVLLGHDKKRARARALELMERVGLPPHFAKRYPAQLSGGQQQRVGVARALAADPPVMLMDEPFSAVDPVVRAQLQNEFLNLQAELGKTIVFVTHDIDEAIKLGDQVAVLQVGGRLAQLAPPAELLSDPADPFVAGFVGRDRGYRALGFADAGRLPVRPERSVPLGAPWGAAREAAVGGWVLITDDDNHPLGWLRPDAVASPRPAGAETGAGASGAARTTAMTETAGQAGGGGQASGADTAGAAAEGAGPGSAGAGAPLAGSAARSAGTVTPARLNLGGTLASEAATLREALDAALSSPSGRGVIVDGTGRLVGTVTASEVLARIEEQRAAGQELTAPSAWEGEAG